MKLAFNGRATRMEVAWLVQNGRLQRASDAAEAFFGDQAPEEPDMFITVAPCEAPEFYLS